MSRIYPFSLSVYYLSNVINVKNHDLWKAYLVKKKGRGEILAAITNFRLRLLRLQL